VYVSSAHDYPITAVSWSPDGDLFAIGSFNTLRLCDKTGVSYISAGTNVNCILNLVNMYCHVRF